MGLKLVPPGARKGNRTFYARGTVGGQRYEVNTKETNEGAARRFAEDLERKLGDEDADLERGRITFKQAAELYLSGGNRSKNETRYVKKLQAYFGNKLIHRILPHHIAAAATAIYPKATPETKNRQAFTPTASVLHYLAENKKCEWLRIKKLPESDPAPRAAGAHNIGTLIAAAENDADLRRLLNILAYQGWRITETLGIEWERISMIAKTFDIRVGKARTWKTIPMHPEVFAELKLVKLADRKGRLFPWRRRERVYDALAPLLKATGIKFTPHMARWDFATDLNDQDVSTVDIKNASTWTSTKSIERYIKTHRGRARAVLGKLPARIPNADQESAEQETAPPLKTGGEIA